MDSHMHSPVRPSRREFLKLASLSSGAVFFPHILRGQAPKKLQFGGIGVEGKGKMDIANTAAGAEIVALCDVDRTRLERANCCTPRLVCLKTSGRCFKPWATSSMA